MSLLAKIQAAKSPARSGVVEVPESTRIVEIPRRDYEGADLNAELRKRGGTLSLFPIQSEALAAARDANGLVAPMAVGEGKTFPALLVGSVLGARLALVLTKAKLVRQTRDADRLVRQHFRVTCTNRVASYASLSRGDFLEELVEHLDPSELVVVCDEAHCLANPSSARTRRVIRFAREYPAVRWVMLTGTFLRKSIKDAAHLAELALRERSPYPAAGVFGTRKTAHLEALAECLDVHGRPSPEDWLLASPLASFAGVDLRALRGAARQSAIRAAFAERVRSAPGVVCSRGERVAASLELVPVTLDTPADVLGAGP